MEARSSNSVDCLEGTKPVKMVNEVPIGDGPCTDCQEPNPFVWFTDNVFWNAVCRSNDEVEPTLCPTCFVKRVWAIGLRPIAMRIIPDWEWKESQK